ncbi:MAG: hypothetical protein UW45_C0010G0004 [Parcubacteria group bacterium GW2011_GWC2_44_22]|nr:MAG: hypothetical protein UW45_C0010G0004 [Parcubacteria group bacterium GW2011_GWC2_44_22]
MYAPSIDLLICRINDNQRCLHYRLGQYLLRNPELEPHSITVGDF